MEPKLKKVTDEVEKIPAMEKNIKAPQEATETLLKKLQLHMEQEPKHRLPESLVNRMLEFPLFDGSDSARWILRMERYFKFHAMDDFAMMIDIIALSMSGEALDWFGFLENLNQLPNSWKDFRNALFERFEGGDTICQRFLALQQEGSVRDYCSQFELFGALLPDIPESLHVAKFMNGLNPLIGAELRNLQPNGILKIMRTARFVEDKMISARGDHTFPEN